VGDTVCELAAGILEEGGWPELLPFLFQAVQAGPDKLRESALLIFAELALYIGGSMGPYLATLHAGAPLIPSCQHGLGSIRCAYNPVAITQFSGSS